MTHEEIDITLPDDGYCENGLFLIALAVISTIAVVGAFIFTAVAR